MRPAWRSIGTCMPPQRGSYEPGHKPKCLVIVDDTAEWDRAVYYASRWAVRAGGGVVMLRIIETEDQNQQWLGVGAIIGAGGRGGGEVDGGGSRLDRQGRRDRDAGGGRQSRAGRAGPDHHHDGGRGRYVP